MLSIGLGLNLVQGGAIPFGPVNTAAPTLSGVGYAYQTLTSTTGTWTGVGSITYTYQWYADCVLISGATSSTYDVDVECEGAEFYCEVTATDDVGSTTAKTNKIHHFVLDDIDSLDFWFDSIDDRYIVESGGNVGAVKNKRNKSEIDVEQGTGSLQPSLTGTGQNQVITFDGIDNVLSTNAKYEPNPTGHSHSWGATYNVTPDVTDSTEVMTLRSPTSANPIKAQLTVLASGALDEVRGAVRTDGGGGSNLFFGGTGNYTGDTIVTANFEYNGAGSNATLNVRGKGAQIYNETKNPPSDTWTFPADSRFTIGANIAGLVSTIDGNIRTCYVYAKSLSIAEREKVEGYLTWRAGLESILDASHTYKSAPPAVTTSSLLENTAAPVLTGTVSTGNTLTCTTGSWDDTVAEYIYEWYSDGSLIVGESSSSYVVEASVDGTTVQVKVYAINSAGKSFGAASNSI